MILQFLSLFCFCLSEFLLNGTGGISNVSGTLGLNYDFNYQKNDWTWENKLIANFDFTKIKNQDIQKSSDLLEWNFVVGKKAKGYWYYSSFLNFKTQFADDLIKILKGQQNFCPLAIFNLALEFYGKKVII